MLIGRTDVEAETPILWPPDEKSWLTGKAPGAGKDWEQEERGTTEDEMAGWHHWLDGHGFGWTPGVGDGQGGLACCGSWGRRVGHDWVTELNWIHIIQLQKWKWMLLSLVRLFATPWTLYTVHGILQARILEWIAVPFSRESSQPRDRSQFSCTAGRLFTSWATSMYISPVCM